MARFQISDVQWDADVDPATHGLPTDSFVFEGDPTDAIFDSGDDEDISDALSDAISDKYGFCHHGFNWKRIV